MKRAVPGRQVAYEQLRRQIVRVKLPPGSTLSENDLAADLGMSRTPVREALMLLREEGLIEALPQIGTFVTRVDPRRVAEAQFLREAVELASLRSLSHPLDEDVVADLRRNLNEQDSLEDDLDRFFDLDESFHKGLMVLADHEATWATVAAAKGHLDRARLLGLQTPSSIHSRAAEHRAVFDAVLGDDMPKAEELLQRHLRLVFDDIRSIQRDNPQLFAVDPNAKPVRRSVIVWG